MLESAGSGRGQNFTLFQGYGIVFDAQFINDCARTQFTYVLMRFSQKHERINVDQDQRCERTDFAVVHASPSIGAGPSIALFRKL